MYKIAPQKYARDEYPRYVADMAYWAQITYFNTNPIGKYMTKPVAKWSKIVWTTLPWFFNLEANLLGLAQLGRRVSSKPVCFSYPS